MKTKRRLRILGEIDLRAPGFLDACKEIGKPIEGGLEFDPGEYKEIQKRFNLSRGLGDTIARVTKAIGIKPCGGCKKRRDKLNEKFPY